LTRLNGNWPGQAATVTPSPPVVFAKPGAAEASGRTAEPAARVAIPRQAVQQTPTPAEAVKAAAAQIESYLRSSGRSLEFRVDGATGRTIVSVRNPQTGELIRQIPGEETLRLASMLGAGGNALIDIAV